MKIKILFLCSLLSFPVSSFGWGPVGHRTIGLIAGSQLSPKAQNAVQKLLGKQSLADVANWADKVRGDGTYPQTVWYHFEKMPDQISYLDHLKSLPDWQKKKGGVVEAILVAQETLREAKAPLSEQADALKFLVHFVGDIHQPLHSGRPEDNGGVKIDVTWFGTPMNLHRIWDSGMIQTGHQNLFTTGQNLEAESLAYANELMRQHSSTPVDTGFNVNQWLMESLQIRQAAYAPLYHSDPGQYQNLHLKEVDLRIYSAGVRLADLLNSIFANEPTPQPEINFWKQIESLVGNLNQLINFRP